MPVTVNLVIASGLALQSYNSLCVKYTKICAHCRQIFHHTIGLTLVQIDGKLELEAGHLFQLQCRTQQA